MTKKIQPPQSPGWAANPNYVVGFDLIPATVAVTFNGRTIAESDRLRCMYELGHAPVYYFPISALNMTYLTRTDHETFCPYKGVAAYWTIEVDGQVAENAIWTYPDAYPELPLLTAAARAAGALGAALSGAGSTIIAFTDDPAAAERVSDALCAEAGRLRLPGRALIVRPRADGARVTVR